MGKKISGTLLSTQASREKIDIITRRLANLSEDDLLTLREEYLGSQIVQAKMPALIDQMIQDRLRAYDRELIAKRTAEIEKIVAELYLKESIVDEIERKEAAGEISEEEANRRIDLASEGSADLIKAYRAKNQEIIRLTSRGREDEKPWR